MSGGQSAPADNSVQVEQMQEQAAQRAADQAKQDAAAKESAFQTQLGNGYNNAISTANQYFTGLGLDPSQYTAQITQAAKNAMGGVPDLASNVGSYFDGLGAQVAGGIQQGDVAQYLRAINTYAPANFATNTISDSAATPYIQSILAEQRKTADGYVRNLLDRGVITPAGYQAAESNLDSQAPGANEQLTELGQGDVAQGRSALNDIAANARSAASNFQLGDTFDPYSYQKNIDQSTSDFFTNLGQKIRASVPSNLFTTSGLAGIAGATQGAGNTAFNPAAVAGVTADETTTPSTTTNTSNPF